MAEGQGAPLLRRAAQYLKGLVGLTRADVLLASYPKSGNTWLRFFLRHYVALSESGETVIDWETLDRTMPEFGVSDLREPWPFRSVPRFVKTHRRWLPVFSGRRSVLIVRDPRDVMVSYFHFELSRAAPRFSGDFAAFIRHRRFGLEAWFRHTRSWLKRASAVLRFERLRASDAGLFEEMLRALGVPYDAARVAEAARRCRYEEVRKLEEGGGRSAAIDARFKPGFRFARSGRSGGWTEHFAPADLAYLEQLRDRYPDVTAWLDRQEAAGA